MKLTSLALLIGAASAAPGALRTTEDIETKFSTWMHEFDQEFSDATEYLSRLGVFAANLKKIEAHNSANKTWSMELNQFAHLTEEEFVSAYTGLKVPEIDASVPRTAFVASSAAADDSADWTTKGAVTAVKNQESCGSCWAFSTTGGLEGAYFNKYGTLPSFSEQQLVSCDTVDSGCNGGLMDNAFDWIKKNGGICAEADYPYASGSGTAPKCTSTCTVVENSAPTGYTDVSTVPQQTPCSEDTMMKAVAQQPISVAIEADQSSFQFYSTGVMTGACGVSLDHGVLVVGYGTDSGSDYWKIKNSWGETWGDAGYIKIARGVSQKGGQCGVLLAASYPNL